MKQNTVPILSLTLPALTQKTALAHIGRLLEQNRPSLVFTPNTTMLYRAWKDPTISAMLQSADLLLPDGSGLVAASHWLGTPLPCRLSGIDIAEGILALAAAKGLRVFFLGGRPGVAQQAARVWKRKLPSLRICGTHHGYFSKAEEPAVARRIRATSPHILLVCLGFPKQEAWLLRSRASFPSLRLGMGLGGSLDVWSGTKKRAPKPVQALGLEWLWRALAEPHRLSILLTVPPLVAELLHQKQQKNAVRQRREKTKKGL